MNLHYSSDLNETSKIAAKWLNEIYKNYANANKAIVAGLSGHLGAGKTAFVKEIAKILGISEEVTSPTFVLMKFYEIPNKKSAENENGQIGSLFKQLVHIDAYRLEKQEELKALKFDELKADPKNLILIEWPENVGLKNFGEHLGLHFEIKDDKHLIFIA